MRGSKRPPSDRTRALAIVAVEGVPAAAEATGIPERTIREWTDDPEFAELRQRTKEAAAEEWWGIVQEAFRRTSQLLGQTEDPVKAATAGAIVFDKMALSLGEATARTETKDVSVDIPDQIKRELRDRFADAVRGEAAAVEAEGEAGPTAS